MDAALKRTVAWEGGSVVCQHSPFTIPMTERYIQCQCVTDLAGLGPGRPALIPKDHKELLQMKQALSLARHLSGCSVFQLYFVSDL